MIRKKHFILVCVLLSLTVIVFAVIVVGLLQRKMAEPLTPTGLELEMNATVGILPGTDLEQRLKALQTQLDESQIAFSINTNPIFASGSAEGNLLLENPANNAKLITAEIVLDETGEVVYQSKALSPGTYLEKIFLDKPLAKGNYAATVYLKAYRQDNQKLIGQTGAAITLAVLK